MGRFQIAHVSTVHPRSDTRIRIKQCQTLSKKYPGQCLLMVQDGLPDEFDAPHSLVIRSCGRKFPRQRYRLMFGIWKMFWCVAKNRVRVVHFHDPELIIPALLWKMTGCKVVYDVHEDYRQQVVAASGKGPLFRWLLPRAISILEAVAGSVFDSIVAATPKVAEQFPVRKTEIIQNFPVLSELHAPQVVRMEERPVQAVYIGGITGIRGAKEMIEALEAVPQRYGLRLALGGTCAPESLREELAVMPGWTKVDELGWIDRATVPATLGRSRMGLVVLHPVSNYFDAYPVKMFEYMAAGVPVIASDFPLWRKIVEDAGCGLLVDPLDPQAIAGAMQWLLDHPQEAEAMGMRGREAVERVYNWESESWKLISVYGGLMPEVKRAG